MTSQAVTAATPHAGWCKKNHGAINTWLCDVRWQDQTGQDKVSLVSECCCLCSVCGVSLASWSCCNRPCGYAGSGGRLTHAQGPQTWAPKRVEQQSKDASWRREDARVEYPQLGGFSSLCGAPKFLENQLSSSCSADSSPHNCICITLCVSRTSLIGPRFDIFKGLSCCCD